MSTVFRPIELPAGVVAKPTKRMRSSNYSETNMVRWVEGRLVPVGGQAQIAYGPFASRCRRIHGWTDLQDVPHTAYLCETNIYVDTGGVLTDISPTPALVAPPPYGSGGYSDGNYSDSTYGTARAVDTIADVTELPNAWSLWNFGQILLVQTSPDGRLLQWNPANGTAGIVANLTAAGAWTTSSTTITMPTNPGTVQPGMNVYDTTLGQEIGTVSTYVGTTLTLTAAALHASSGAADTLQFGNVLTQVTGAPHGRGFVITQERFVWMYGVTQDGSADGGSFRRFAWCSQENMYDWNYSSVTNTAGYLDVEPASPIVTAHATRSGVLFWTGKKAYLSGFVGLPYVYNYVELAEACTPWSPCSVSNTSSMAVWMSQQGMFSFDGTSVMPILCPVREWVDQDCDPLEVRDLPCLVHVAPFNEVWWFFPQNQAGRNSRAIIYNYKEGWWSQARMGRSAGITANYTTWTIMADGTVPYRHELGIYYAGGVPLPWADTFDLNLNSGARLTTVKQLLPDIDGAASALNYSFFYSRSRAAPVEAQTPPITIRSDGYVDVRVTGRDIRMRIAVIGPSVPPLSLGQHLVDSVQRGDR